MESDLAQLAFALIDNGRQGGRMDFRPYGIDRDGRPLDDVRL